MSIKHTPGPWKADGSFVGPASLPTLIQVREVRGVHLPEYAEILANANLIAAAPDLLAFVNAVANVNTSLFSISSAQIFAKALLAKTGLETGERYE